VEFEWIATDFAAIRSRLDKQENTVDLLTAKRDHRAERRFFTRAVKNSSLPKIGFCRVSDAMLVGPPNL
jgi:hypothetical protein